MAKRIAIIGAGNMGGAFYEGLKAVMAEEDLFLCNRSPEKMSALKPIHSSQDVNEAVDFADIVVLAVKPQSFDELAGAIRSPLKDKLVVSIMGGVSIARIQKSLNAEKVIACLPNLGVKIGAGVVPWVASREVSESEKATVQKIFSAFGLSVEVANEALMRDAGTVTGCGPAYFFLLCELLEEKLKNLGFSKKDARAMAEMTFAGSAGLLKTDKRGAAEWRAAVTSKKGITEAALEHLKTNRWNEIFQEAMDVAANKAKKRAEEMDQ